MSEISNEKALDELSDPRRILQRVNHLREASALKLKNAAVILGLSIPTTAVGTDLTIKVLQSGEPAGLMVTGVILLGGSIMAGLGAKTIAEGALDRIEASGLQSALAGHLLEALSETSPEN